MTYKYSSYTNEKMKIERQNDHILNDLKCIFIDVDGSLTDGQIIYDDNGNEYKKFNVKDAAAFFACKLVGIETVVVTGRESSANKYRLTEIGASSIHQDIRKKSLFINDYASNKSFEKENMAFFGDDLNDLSAMKMCGYNGCPNDAVQEIKSYSNYICRKPCGFAPFREFVENILKERNQWETVINSIYY